MATFPDRVPTAERLPTREQIAEITDIASLVAIQDDVCAAAKQIEVDLEYRSDDDADEIWEHRARRALAAHHICAGHLARRISFLNRGGKPVPQGDPDSKARKAEAHAALLLAQAEARRQKQFSEREKTARLVIQAVNRQSILAHFHQIVVEEFGGKEAGRLMALARSRFELSLTSELPATGIAQPEEAAPETGIAQTPDAIPGDHPCD